jgi:hypothetical protein
MAVGAGIAGLGAYVQGDEQEPSRPDQSDVEEVVRENLPEPTYPEYPPNTFTVPPGGYNFPRPPQTAPPRTFDVPEARERSHRSRSRSSVHAWMNRTRVTIRERRGARAAPAAGKRSLIF